MFPQNIIPAGLSELCYIPPTWRGDVPLCVGIGVINRNTYPLIARSRHAENYHGVSQAL